jgi:DNA helicase II / ATP-dependent DNA helicase PcrA
MAGAAPRLALSAASPATSWVPRCSASRRTSGPSTGHILGAANAVIAQDPARLGKTLFTPKRGGGPVEIVRCRNAEAEAFGIVGEITRRRGEGLAWDDIAILYRSNPLSRGFEEALMRARIPYALIGDVGFYQRAEIKDALALVCLAVMPDDAQAEEALRRVINVPARGFGAKTRRSSRAKPRGLGSRPARVTAAAMTRLLSGGFPRRAERC